MRPIADHWIGKVFLANLVAEAGAVEGHLPPRTGKTSSQKSRNTFSALATADGVLLAAWIIWVPATTSARAVPHAAK